MKLAEIVCSMLAGAILPGMVYNHASVYSFFSFVAWTAFINALIDMILHLTSLWNRLLYICRAPEVFLVLCGVASGAFALAGILVAAYARSSSEPGAAIASACFGFFCALLFGIEAVMHFASFRDGRRENVRQEEPDEFAEPI